MAKFQYKARNSNGSLVVGEIDAPDAKTAKVRIASDGLLPVSVTAKGTELKLPDFLTYKKPLKLKDLMAFTRQFAVLFRAGVSMDKIFNTLSRQIPHKEFKLAVETVRNDVASGSTLMGAFSKHPQFFNELYINMLNVGEQSGTLDQSLFGLSSILERDNTIVSKIKSATIYPKIVIVIFTAVLVLMMTFVLPQFAKFYSGFGAELPLPTRIMMTASTIFVKYWYMVGGAVFGIYILVKRYAKTPAGTLRFDQWRFKYPVFGTLNEIVANARFGHLVGALYKSGVPLVRTLTIVGKAIGNRAYQLEVDAVGAEVQQGSALAAALQGKKYFTPIVVESVAVGEESGSLDEMLEITAVFYDEEATNMLQKLTTLIEPLLLVGLFGMVLLLALAVFLPMWKVASVVLPPGS